MSVWWGVDLPESGSPSGCRQVILLIRFLFPLSQWGPSILNVGTISPNIPGKRLSQIRIIYTHYSTSRLTLVVTDLSVLLLPWEIGWQKLSPIHSLLSQTLWHAMTLMKHFCQYIWWKYRARVYDFMPFFFKVNTFLDDIQYNGSDYRDTNSCLAQDYISGLRWLAMEAEGCGFMPFLSLPVIRE